MARSRRNISPRPPRFRSTAFPTSTPSSSTPTTRSRSRWTARRSRKGHSSIPSSPRSTPRRPSTIRKTPNRPTGSIPRRWRTRRLPNPTIGTRTPRCRSTTRTPSSPRGGSTTNRPRSTTRTRRNPTTGTTRKTEIGKRRRCPTRCVPARTRDAANGSAPKLTTPTTRASGTRPWSITPTTSDRGHLKRSPTRTTLRTKRRSPTSDPSAPSRWRSGPCPRVS
mmetsp:Transcript_10228/g.46928  ORF Transcript_10228/g.46928 Transcript_10228/m.46928 type:complete len:222 (+) Transcript_10228:624-1289(+)